MENQQNQQINRSVRKSRSLADGTSAHGSAMIAMVAMMAMTMTALTAMMTAMMTAMAGIGQDEFFFARIRREGHRDILVTLQSDFILVEFLQDSASNSGAGEDSSGYIHQ